MYVYGASKSNAESTMKRAYQALRYPSKTTDTVTLFTSMADITNHWEPKSAAAPATTVQAVIGAITGKGSPVRGERAAFL